VPVVAWTWKLDPDSSNLFDWKGTSALEHYGQIISPDEFNPISGTITVKWGHP
jgi:hypothetical protein